MVITDVNYLLKRSRHYATRSIYSHWALLCMEKNQHYDAYIDFAVKYALSGRILTKGQNMSWNVLIILLIFFIMFVESKQELWSGRKSLELHLHLQCVIKRRT